MNAPTYHTTFLAPGQRAQLTCTGGRCLLEVSFDVEPPTCVHCEVLLQRADELGLAAGPPVCLACVRLAPRARACGREALLPRGIDALAARRCYLRIDGAA